MIYWKMILRRPIQCDIQYIDIELIYQYWWCWSNAVTAGFNSIQANSIVDQSGLRFWQRRFPDLLTWMLAAKLSSFYIRDNAPPLSEQWWLFGETILWCPSVLYITHMSSFHSYWTGVHWFRFSHWQIHRAPFHCLKRMPCHIAWFAANATFSFTQNEPIVATRHVCWVENVTEMPLRPPRPQKAVSGPAP